jgi:transcriptional regulator with XRE-family HTH domain
VVTDLDTIDGAQRSQFAVRLREAMGRAGHTRSSLARNIGVHPNRVGDWMSGTRWPQVRHLMLAAHELGVTTDWLLTGRDGPSPNRDATFDRIARRIALDLAELVPPLTRLARDAQRATAHSHRSRASS